MKILLLGYGKMGKLISELAEKRGHEIIAKISIENVEDLDNLDPEEIDVAIEFSQPESAVSNITWAIERHIPVVAGTTGWLDDWKRVTDLVNQKSGTLFYASNFSIGVNIFFKANKYLAKLMNDTDGYSASIKEIHHTAKLDAPSGTAITTAEGIINNHKGYDSWTLTQGEPVKRNSVPVESERVDPTPGTHIVKYDSPIDLIELSHTAHSREGFVKGAVLVAEWILDKKGVLNMNDFLSFEI